MKNLKLVLLLSIFGVLCALSAAQPSESSSSMGAMYTSSHHPDHDWLSTGYGRYPYMYYYNYYYPYNYNYYPYYYNYYPYNYNYGGYPWYWSGYSWGY